MSDAHSSPVLITGANGNLGKKLIERLAGRPIRAVVRSNAARQDLESWITGRKLSGVDILLCDYLDLPAMRAAAAGCDYAVHLVGIIKEAGANTFQRAHVETTEVLLQALAGSGVKKVCYLSLVGAAPDSANPCLASRAEAEVLFLGAAIPALVLRIPMVLGEGDYASRALQEKARARLCLTFRAESLEQPIYAGDVVTAVAADIERNRGATAGMQLLELAGPESLRRRELIQRAGAAVGNRPRVLSLPLGLGLGMAWLLEKISRTPPVSRAMLQVLDHDDAIDPAPACQALGIELTPLDEMLARCLRV